MRKNIYHISDEAYEYFHYDGSNHFSPGSLPLSSDHTLSLYSLSKAYGFTSWRIGYMVMPPHLMPSMRKIQDTNLICAPVVSQYAATQALQIGRSYCSEHLSTMDRVRRHLIGALTPLAPWLQITPAKGAFYLLIRLECRQHPLEVVRYWLVRNTAWPPFREMPLGWRKVVIFASPTDLWKHPPRMKPSIGSSLD